MNDEHNPSNLIFKLKILGIKIFVEDFLELSEKLCKYGLTLDNEGIADTNVLSSFVTTPACFVKTKSPGSIYTENLFNLINIQFQIRTL